MTTLTKTRPKVKRCGCGKILQGRQRIQCSQCYLKHHPGSSQCPLCFRWYITHGGASYEVDRKFHNSGKCKKGGE